MTKSDWNHLFAVLAAGIALAAVVSVVGVRPRRQLLLPLVVSLGSSSIIYLAVMSTLDVNKGEKGADLFHVAALIALGVAVGLGVMVDRIRAARHTVAYVCWSLLGATLPPVLVIVFLVAACGANGRQCFA
jgi:hypothetical protein